MTKSALIKYLVESMEGDIKDALKQHKLAKETNNKGLEEYADGKIIILKHYSELLKCYPDFPDC